MNENEESKYSYTYSASLQEELKSIREKYAPPSVSEEDAKLERLRLLDAGVERKGLISSLAAGVTGLLIMGAGMSLVMTDLGARLGISSMVPGVTVGVIGMLLTAAAYPIYKRVTKREREKVSPEILRLTDELMK